MTALSATQPTLLDWARSLAPDGSIATVAELLALQNEVLLDIPWVQGNLETGHQTTIRSGLPDSTWRKLNYGVQPDKSQKVTVTDTCGILSAYNDVDKDIADLNGDASEFRASEAKAQLESMSQEFASTLFYGASTAPEEFVGLTERYSSSSAENANNLILHGGSGSDNASIWLIAWDESTIHGIYPKASSAGLSMKDLGEVTLQDAANGLYQGYRTHFQWKCGLTVRDWRYAVRIANIDVSDLGTLTNTDEVVQSMIKATHRLQAKTGRVAFYMNSDVMEAFDLGLSQLNQYTVRYDDAGNLMFRGIPVRRCDALTSAETLVS